MNALEAPVAIEAGAVAARPGEAGQYEQKSAGDIPRDAGSPADFHVERVRGARAVLTAVAACRAAGGLATGFQTEAWYEPFFSGVVPHAGAEPNLIRITTADTGALVMALPLVVRRLSGIAVAEFADLGLSDYCVPLLGPAAPSSPEVCPALIARIASVLDDVDLLRLEKMPRDVDGVPNVLAIDPSAASSRFVGNRLMVATTVRDFIASRGKKYRKEAERSHRRLADMGRVSFGRATTVAEIDEAYRALEAWQSARHREAGHDYWLDRPEISQFYRNVLVNGLRDGQAGLFALRVDGVLVAVLLGVTYRTTFTLLRISDAGEPWRHCSPGRLIVLDTMHYLADQGVRTFDMGIGDYPFKRWIGCAPYNLYELEVAMRWKAWPTVWLARVKRTMRRNQTVLAFARRIKGLAGEKPQHYPLD